MIRMLLLCTAAFGLSAAAYAQEDPPEVVGGSVRSAQTIAVPAMPVQAGASEALGRQIAAVIAADLRSTGAFTPLGPNGIGGYSVAQATAPAYGEWRSAGAGALVFSKQTPDLLAGIARCLWCLGGVPRLLVWDRQVGIHAEPSQAVTRPRADDWIAVSTSALPHAFRISCSSAVVRPVGPVPSSIASLMYDASAPATRRAHARQAGGHWFGPSMAIM